MQEYYIDNGGASTAYAPQKFLGSIFGSVAGEAIGKRFGRPKLGSAIGGAVGFLSPFEAPAAPVAYATSPYAPALNAPAGYAPMAVPVAGPQGVYQPQGIGSAIVKIAKPLLVNEGKKLVRKHAPSVIRKARRWGRKLFGFQAHPYAPVQYAEIDVEIDEEGNEIAPMGFAPQFAPAPAFEPQSLQPMGVAYPDGEIVPMAGPIGEAVANWAPIVADGVQLIGKIAQYSPWSIEPGYPLVQQVPVQQVPVQPRSPAIAPVYGAPAYA